MGTWNVNKIPKSEKYLIAFFVVWFLYAWLKSSDMTFMDEAGCNISEEKRTEQQNEDCDFTD